MLAYTCGGSGLDICRIDTDGAAASNLTPKTKPFQITRNEVDDLNPDWSQDAKRIVFESRRG